MRAAHVNGVPNDFQVDIKVAMGNAVAHQRWLAACDQDSPATCSRSYGAGFLGDDVAELGWQVIKGQHIHRYAQQLL